MTKNPEVSSQPTIAGFLDHLDELRSRLIKSIIALIVGIVAYYPLISPTLDSLLKPIGQVVYTSPGDALLAQMTVMLIGGLIVASPIVIYQLWRFLSVGLKDNERKNVQLYAPLAGACFLLGVCFAYFVAIPFSIRFLLSMSTPKIVPMITINSYLSFVGTMLLSFGVVFELPLILIFLTKIGIATPEFLIQKRRYAIVFIFIISAIMTPPDVFSQCVMAFPLLILYEIGIIACRLTYRPKEG